MCKGRERQQYDRYYLDTARAKRLFSYCGLWLPSGETMELADPSAGLPVPPNGHFLICHENVSGFSAVSVRGALQGVSTDSFDPLEG